MELTPKYIKDHEGNAVSPITAAETVFLKSGKSVESAIKNGVGDGSDIKEELDQLLSRVDDIESLIGSVNVLLQSRLDGAS